MQRNWTELSIISLILQPHMPKKEGSYMSCYFYHAIRGKKKERKKILARESDPF